MVPCLHVVDCGVAVNVHVSVCFGGLGCTDSGHIRQALYAWGHGDVTDVLVSCEAGVSYKSKLVNSVICLCI